MVSGKNCVFEGFSAEAASALTDFFRSNYNLPLNFDEASGKGWNWGKVDVKPASENSPSSLNYSVAGRLAFNVPLTNVTNALVASKNELALEFANGLHSCVAADEKDDFITEIRFYIPDEKEDNSDEDEEGEGEGDLDVEQESKAKKAKTEELMDPEELDTTELEGGKIGATSILNSLANVLLEEIKANSDFSKISGDAIAALPEIACVVPRGRYRIDMFNSFLRLHGKSYDYKIDYISIQKLFLVPKTDDAHILLVLALDPPLKQGQTRYPHLIMQFPKEERIDEFQLNSLTPSDLSGTYGGKLQAKYSDVSTFELVSVLFRGLAGQKIVVPGVFKSVITGHPALKCTIKANEGALYPLEKNFLFLPKPTLLIPHSDISRCVFSRVGGHGNPRSFDLKISVRGTGAEHLFSNISKEELDILVEYLRTKQIAFTTEEEGRPNIKKKLGEDDQKALLDDEEDDEDESTDEDYDVDNDSEDEDGDGSDDESDDGSYDGSEDDEDEGSGSEDEEDEEEDDQ
jgi:structure-specific recognition protein 1